MPAIIHTSNLGYTGGIALIGESINIETSGLVRVEIEYSIKEETLKTLNTLFALDAPPPIYPTGIVRDNLQRRSLHCQSYKIENARRLLAVQASYVGALTVATGFRGLIQRDKEARVTPAVAYESGYNIVDEEREATFDTVSVKFLAQTVTRTIAATQSSFFDVEKTQNDARGYISRVEYGAINKATPDVRTRFSYPPPKDILETFSPFINISTSVDNITNAVVICTTTEEVSLRP